MFFSMEMLWDTQKSFGLLSITSKIQSLKSPSPFKNSWDRITEKQNGAGEGIRTLDIHLGKVVLYQLSYARKEDYSEIMAGKKEIFDARKHFIIEST
jgi:hypothetical protein